MSSMESKQYPIFAVQWHPEKPLFEWNPNEVFIFFFFIYYFFYLVFSFFSLFNYRSPITLPIPFMLCNTWLISQVSFLFFYPQSQTFKTIFPANPLLLHLNSSQYLISLSLFLPPFFPSLPSSPLQTQFPQCPRRTTRCHLQLPTHLYFL